MGMKVAPYTKRSGGVTMDDVKYLVEVIVTVIAILFFVLLFAVIAHADTPLKASWYSEESLKREGTWKTSQGVMANGKKFNEKAFTCACRLYPLGTKLCITNIDTGNKVVVEVTDRIGKRFANSRIDLSKHAFEAIGELKQGLINIKVEVI
jgi:rare lipoprotein A